MRMTNSNGDERKYPKERNRGKTRRSRESDNIRMVRIFKRWTTREERQHGIEEVGGWRDIRWREDHGLWLVWSEPRVRPATSIPCSVDVDETLVSPAAGLLSLGPGRSVLGSRCPSLIVMFPSRWLVSVSDVAMLKVWRMLGVSRLFVVASLGMAHRKAGRRSGNMAYHWQSRFWSQGWLDVDMVHRWKKTKNTLQRIYLPKHLSVGSTLAWFHHYLKKIFGILRKVWLYAIGFKDISN